MSSNKSLIQKDSSQCLPQGPNLKPFTQCQLCGPVRHHSPLFFTDVSLCLESVRNGREIIPDPALDGHQAGTSSDQSVSPRSSKCPIESTRSMNLFGPSTLGTPVVKSDLAVLSGSDRDLVTCPWLHREPCHGVMCSAPSKLSHSPCPTAENPSGISLHLICAF